MAGRHDERAEQNRAAPAEEAVGEEAAEDGRKINGGRVSAEDRRRERLAVETEVKLPETGERRDVLDPSRLEEIVDHVEDEQRLHAVVGKAFPRLGEGEVPKPARMTEEVRLVFFPAERGGILWFGDGGHGRRW